MLGCKDDEEPPCELTLQQILVGPLEISLSGSITEDVPVDRSINLIFSNPIDRNTVSNSITLQNDGGMKDYNTSFSMQDRQLIISPIGVLEANSIYTLGISDQFKDVHGQVLGNRSVQFKTASGDLQLQSVMLGGTEITGQNRILNTPLDFEMILEFSTPVDIVSLEQAVNLSGPQAPSLAISLDNNQQTATIEGTSPLPYLTSYNFSISTDLMDQEGQNFDGYQITFATALDPTPKFPLLPLDDLLTRVQAQTFKYFWDFGHPVSGLARERNTSGELVTIGGSGFGLMAIIVGIERGFITRDEGISRLQKIVGFLGSEADRFHGVWSHWLNGSTGEVIPFSADDDGADLVETAFMAQGLITVRQYLDQGNAAESGLITEINTLLSEIEWNWFTQDGQDVLYWHWSPNFGWQKNLAIRGYNEALIIYVLAAGSSTFPIDADVYHQGWARQGAMVNGESFLGYTLPLGPDFGGPLFFSHYSFLGLDPRNLSDQYANYWDQNISHTLINRQWCISNPNNYVGYSDNIWGLTASDNHQGYSAHSPTNDLGVITPTAALSSMPYAPDLSIEALAAFYYSIGDRLWGDYGFYDAFNFSQNWVADSYLAIDQGPIIIMIENHRTGLIWDLFMTAPEVQNGLEKLGFSF